MTQPTSKEINALLPCPFCGSPAKIERAGTMRRSNIVICTNCGARLESGDVFDPTASWNRRRIVRADETREAGIVACSAEENRWLDAGRRLGLKEAAVIVDGLCKDMLGRTATDTDICAAIFAELDKESEPKEWR